MDTSRTSGTENKSYTTTSSSTNSQVSSHETEDSLTTLYNAHTDLFYRVIIIAVEIILGLVLSQRTIILIIIQIPMEAITTQILMALHTTMTERVHLPIEQVNDKPGGRDWRLCLWWHTRSSQASEK